MVRGGETHSTGLCSNLFVHPRCLLTWFTGRPQAYQIETWVNLGLESVSIIDFFKKYGSHDLHVKIQAKHEIQLYKRSIIDTDYKPRSAQITFC